MLPDYNFQKVLFLIVRFLSELYNGIWSKLCCCLRPGQVSIQRIIMRHRPAYFDNYVSDHFAALHTEFADIKTIFQPNTTVKIRKDQAKFNVIHRNSFSVKQLKNILNFARSHFKPLKMA